MVFRVESVGVDAVRVAFGIKANLYNESGLSTVKTVFWTKLDFPHPTTARWIHNRLQFLALRPHPSCYTEMLISLLSIILCHSVGTSITEFMSELAVSRFTSLTTGTGAFDDSTGGVPASKAN